MTINQESQDTRGIVPLESQRDRGWFDGVRDFIELRGGTVHNLTKNIASDFGYPRKYAPLDISLQVARLKELFPKIGDPHKETFDRIKSGDSTLPVSAEAWFAIPQWSKIGKNQKEALGRVVELLKINLPGGLEDCATGWFSICEGIGHEEAIEYKCEKTKKAFSILASSQGDADILLVPAQFGLRYGSRSFCQSNYGMSDDEFGLSAFDVGIMLLLHPERLPIDPQEMYLYTIVCSGSDAISPTDDLSYPDIFCFTAGMESGNVYLCKQEADCARSHFSVATGFLSQLEQESFHK